MGTETRQCRLIQCMYLLSYAYLEDPVKRMTSLAREQIEVIAEDATGRAESVVREYGASMSWEVPDRQLTHPLVQYQETDYCFLRRILSHLGTDVISISRFGGSPKLDNLVSQAQRVNQSDYNIIENQWAKAIENGKK